MAQATPSPATPPTPLVRRAGTAIWRQIEEALASDILSGVRKGRLPNETELAEQFGVNRHTVRQAAKALAERGLVEVVHGRGTFVRENLIDYELGRRTRLAHSLDKARRVGISRVQGHRELIPSPDVLELLTLPPGSSVIQIDTLDVVDERVVGVCTQYFPLPRFAGFAQVYQTLGKTHLALAHFGVAEFQRKLSRASARLPEREVAVQLDQPAAQPILYVETIYVDAAGSPIEYGISRFNSTAVQLVIEP
ncbi:phosphonate metabolism transcriptional regulator PhnF [Chitinimonas prasina]|uniref:Phosphonate metabolism transcriptional regulator PhnF n=1 Tax=Chitinimonas prasina TaxID=1434937 RepID=A0ABQ5YG00_9NEIS|nr:phosphonate metabolism transcriptional regulator PhnF [Chitinimonas prasina]GLR13511.1 phosphonate metabolism transcriptional regulator PhnF [Chitinimonas prasina]